jgi:hypothetical protein
MGFTVPPAGASAESEMKGLSLRSYPVVLAALRGEETSSRMMSYLPDEIADALRTGGIAASSWYPVSWKRELHRAGSRATGEPFLARLMGAEMTRRDLRGIYRIFMRIVSARYVLQAGARIFNTYLRPGQFRVDEVRNGFAQATVTGCRGFDHNMWLDVAGGCEATLEVAGAKSVRLHIIDGGRDGDTHCTAQAWWTDDVNARPSAPGGARGSSP